MWSEYFNVASIEEALRLLAERGSRARIVAGATDLILEIERGVRSGIDTLIDISRMPGLDHISWMRTGPSTSARWSRTMHCAGLQAHPRARLSPGAGRAGKWAPRRSATAAR